MVVKLDVAKRGFQRFCENTSCHGFQEMFLAKTFFWKVFWVIVCFGSFGVTAYQVINTIWQYIYSSTTTVIITAEEKEIMYPPLRLCYWHWLYWVDFSKVSRLKIDKEALLFSFNFYTRIYSTVPYDVDEAEQKLTNYLVENNFSSVFKFHQSIARSVPIVSDTNLAAYFDKTEVTFRNPGFMFCYTITSDRLFQYFVDYLKTLDIAEKKKVIKFSTMNENFERNANSMSSFVSFTEYNHYMLRWITHKTQYRITDALSQNFTTFSPPVLLFPNAFNDQSNVPIISETDEYTVNMKASACRWRNSPTTPCVEDDRFISPNATCQFICEARVYKPNCSCVRYHYAVFMKKDTPHNVCRDEFYLLSPDGDEYLAHSTTPNQTVFSQVCLKSQQLVDNFINCMNQCPEACEIWSYDVSVLLTTMPSFVRTVGAKDKTNVTLEYPLKNDILIMVEINNQSWETFVGNVGGLLGIWTGASIVSFIQLFYLCCCVDIESYIDTSYIFSKLKNVGKPNAISIISIRNTNIQEINTPAPIPVGS